MPIRQRGLGLMIVVLGATPVAAQDRASGPCITPTALVTAPTDAGARELVRAAEVTGAVVRADPLIERGYERVSVCEPLPFLGSATVRSSAVSWEVELLPARMAVMTNTGYARDANNGALWAGRGPSLGLSAGAVLRLGPLSAVIAPEVYYQANRPFETITVTRAGYSPLAYPHRSNIDWPQRMGEEALWTAAPGQSTVRLDYRGAAVGVSTENLWWGPGIRNALIMSSTAPGFPHAFAGTSRPLDIWIGTLGLQAVWGQLRESDHFDDDDTNDRKLLTALVGTFSPGFLPGLHLGGTRIFYRTLPPEGLPTSEYFRMFEGLYEAGVVAAYGTALDPADQMVSVFARWILEESDFEGYVEWGRNDRNKDTDDLLQEPEHTQAYVLGFQKVIAGEGPWFRLGAELTHLERTITFQDRVTPVWYAHYIAEGGYTHEGQLLGAWIGPSSSSQFVTADIMASWGMAGLYAERVRHDTDTYYAVHSRWLVPGTTARPIGQRYCECYDWTHDVELTIGARGVVLWRDLRLTPELAYTYRMHRNFRDDDRSWFLRLEASWNPSLAWHLLRPTNSRRDLPR